MSKDLTDKELLAMGKKVKKRVLFKDYVGTYCNLGLQNRDMKTIRKELPAIAKRGAGMIMKNILKKTKMPKLPKHQRGFISIVIYAGFVDTLDGETKFVYPAQGADNFRIEEV